MESLESQELSARSEALTTLRADLEVRTIRYEGVNTRIDKHQEHLSIFAEADDFDPDRYQRTEKALAYAIHESIVLSAERIEIIRQISDLEHHAHTKEVLSEIQELTIGTGEVLSEIRELTVKTGKVTTAMYIIAFVMALFTAFQVVWPVLGK